MEWYYGSPQPNGEPIIPPDTIQDEPSQPNEKSSLLPHRRRDEHPTKRSLFRRTQETVWTPKNREMSLIMIKALTLVIALTVFLSEARGLARNNAGPTYQFCLLILSSGDSYTSTNFDINGAQPSLPDNPMGNTDLGNGQTSANGPVWINYLTTKYQASPVVTYNFGVGGAVIPDNYTYQVNNLYQPKYTTDKFWTGQNTLHLSWIGINDCSFCWLQGGNFTLISDALNQYSALMETMYQTGAKNLFIVNVPPLNRSPLLLEDGSESAERYASCVQNFNENLASYVQTWQSNHPDATIKIYDVHTFFSKVLDNPTAYSFTDNTCQDADNCIWAGSFHILSAMHEIIAKDMKNMLSQFVYNG
ncbi:Acetylesterase [Lachnellula suecica]|uniref:Acetylesterase n=1 Tax=Lachnellula suecica TaxID=602035 RepID=A0A8T9CFY1_9HELO|nr:Acetylesterase [Lachnellula suecica]